MPVLPMEPAISPDDLFSARDELGDDSVRWWALHTRPRAEKALARRLLLQRIAYFLPLHQRRRRIQRRMVNSYLPVFPGYLFLRGTEASRRWALETRFVASCLHVADQELLNADLARIADLIRAGMSLLPAGAATTLRAMLRSTGLMGVAPGTGSWVSMTRT